MYWFYFVICCMLKRIAVIGWWAAGMMAAATICEHAPMGSYELHVFEKNSLLGNKVLISGGGRCNVTTGYYKKQDFLWKYIRGADFLKESLAAFGPRKVYNWFEDHGVPLKLEKDMRVFPVSDNGKDVVGAFEKIFADYEVQVHFKEWVKQLNVESWRYKVTTDKDSYDFDMLVLTTGGNAYAHTGSSGEWYDLARAVGHTITSLWPSLNSFQTPHPWMHELTGLSFPRARLEFTFADWRKEWVDGPMLLTHFGISGPNVFALSALLAFEKISSDSPIVVVLYPEADTSYDQWLTRLNEAVHHSPKKEIRTVLKQRFPERLAVAILAQCTITSDTWMVSTSKDMKKQLAQFLSWWWNITLTMRKPGDEFVTAGGVSLDEVNSSTLESKIVPWLYFAGEILDVDGVTGGFNLQACWSAGYVVGKSIVTAISW